ncbi:hypothetical protein Gotri_000520 [Gossypium trilobum]|uniref:non-specific serine/threonine protein kinase n=1 Tax=Gossypium trilobum TaxID=34281 RepID=A0A7J9FBK8_9ROSI|nr:hypothetical protein [Gossypium trilobum]
MDVRILFLMLILPWAASQSFNFTSFDTSNDNIRYKGDARPINSTIQLTNLDVWRSGHAIYAEPMHLWDKYTGNLAGFTTHFTFSIQAQTNITPADGLAFFVASLEYHVPDVPDGSGIGLATGTLLFNSTENPFVAVEFDTYHNDWDPENNHVGIDINSVVSNKTIEWYSGGLDGEIIDVWISYSASSKILQVSFTGFGEDNTTIQQSLQYELDLRDYLSEWVTFGFASATGIYYELNTIHSWYFSSYLQIPGNKKGNIKFNTIMKVGFVVLGSFILLFGICLIFLFLRKKKRREKNEVFAARYMDKEFERVSGAKKRTFAELIEATNNFAERRKIGEGGFGAVYRGFLKDLNSEVAIKRISTISSQGIKEYASEVRITSQLRHKNLVQLIGWCHEKKELLLVYEFMLNGSLDSHLFDRERLLEWRVRYDIAQGLASSLHYLHFECKSCVLHRDIKASNVLLDSNFNAKLGDFGLARIVSHEKAPQSTKFGGTLGYMAPEYVSSGTASQETDVYSFGIVALEIACGRRPIVANANRNEINIVEWLWGLYAKAKHIEAADPRLEGKFNQQQMERLMIVGLSCAHPDFNSRPSIKQVIRMLNSEVSPPILPFQMPRVPNDFPGSSKGTKRSFMPSHATTSTLRRIFWT